MSYVSLFFSFYWKLDIMSVLLSLKAKLFTTSTTQNIFCVEQIVSIKVVTGYMQFSVRSLSYVLKLPILPPSLIKLCTEHPNAMYKYSFKLNSCNNVNNVVSRENWIKM